MLVTPQCDQYHSREHFRSLFSNQITQRQGRKYDQGNRREEALPAYLLGVFYQSPTAWLYWTTESYREARTDKPQPSAKS
jgi:hypothetical protein